MPKLSIKHSDWDDEDEVLPSAVTVVSATADTLTISVALAEGKTASYIVTGTFTGLNGTDLSTLDGTITGLTVSIDGVQQLVATGLSAPASEIADDNFTDVHDLLELAFGDDDEDREIRGSDDDDDISGRGGDDNLHGGRGRDHLDGADGDDHLDGGDGDDNISGGLGDDMILGGVGNDRLEGGAGNDTLNGGAGADRLNGGAGDDILIGGIANDMYFVNTRGDRISESATGGVDTAMSSISETLDANVEKLVLTGSAAINGTGNGQANTLTGNTGANSLSGAAGDDRLNGGGGSDKLSGGSGKDHLGGGNGKDILTGGDGADTFVFTAISDTGLSEISRDVITDFQHGLDHIDLSGIDADGTLAGDNAFTSLITRGGFTAPGQLKFVGSTLFGNTDTDAAPEFAIHFKGSPTVDLADFIL